MSDVRDRKTQNMRDTKRRLALLGSWLTCFDSIYLVLYCTVEAFRQIKDSIEFHTFSYYRRP